MAINAIRKAIYEEFTDDDLAELYQNINGRMYYAYAPEMTEKPYCVFSIISIDYDFTFDLEFEDLTVQFDYYAERIV